MEDNQREAERRIEEARRTGAEKLDLGDLGLSELPASLSGLGKLRELYLGRIGFAAEEEPKWFSERTDLTFTDLSPLSGLQDLQSLYLPGCESVSDLSALSDLEGLHRLNLHNTKVSDLTPLSGLKCLQSLDLSHCLIVSDLSPLSDLPGLQSLELRTTRMSDLSPLSGLQNLQSLDLSFCPNVSDLSPLSDLQELQSLDLQFCEGVSDLSPLLDFPVLQSLKIFQVGAEIPSHLLKALAERPLLTNLIANTATCVPREVLSLQFFDNCLPRLRAYLHELKLGARAENEVKVILLGNGRVGKTQLCRRFRGAVYQDASVSTHGVQLWREPLTLKSGGEEQTFQVNWWDFGGQDIYHGTHALFLRSRAVFLILWTPHLEDRKEYDENGIPLRNQPLAYWLDYVRTLAGPGSAVIVVQSQCDRLSDRQQRQIDAHGFGFFESCYYSAKSDDELGRESLEGHLKGAIRYLLERSGALEIGSGRAQVREDLYRWRSADQVRKPEEREHRTVTIEEFRELCDQAGDIVSWEHALDYLHQTGVVFYDPTLFSNLIVLDQTWVLDAIYAVFHRSQTAPWLRDSGRFTREDLGGLAWREHSPEEQCLFLGLMQSCGVCFPIGQTPKGEGRFIAPDLLPSFETVRLPAWEEKPDLPTLRLEYRFFHHAVIRGLMREIGGEAEDRAEYWKYGFWFQDGKQDTQLLLQFEDTSSEQAPGAGALVVRAQGADPLGLLREIRMSILWQRIGEKPDEQLTLDGVTVSREALVGAIDGKVRSLDGKPVPATTFEAFFSKRGGSFEEHGEAGRSDLAIQPRSLDENDKPHPEVYISYAWGDDSPAGKVRSRTVDELYSALKSDGFAPVRDRAEMESGDQISRFIDRLTRADLVVAVISEKYLRSPFCLYEIYRLWQRSQERTEVMGQCLVPVILPEVRLDGFLDREPYLRFWAEQAARLEPLIRDPLLRPSGRSWEEVRLTRKFADDVDGILVFLNDILMPHNLEVHLDNGFEAVRDALRRRVAGRKAHSVEPSDRRPN